MKKQNFVSIFSGIGGLDLGFQEKFDCALAVEIEKIACDMLEKNREKFHPGMKVWNKSVYEVSDAEILQFKGAVALVGGPNCQPFSPAKGMFDPHDTRIQGIFEYLRWVQVLDVEFFVFENTFGLLQKNKKEIFDLFVERANSLGYDVEYEIWNAHDHGSVQDRKRLIAIGIKRGSEWSFQKPTPLEDHEKKFVRDILRNEPDGETMEYSDSRRRIMSFVPEGGHWRQLPTEELKIEALGEKNYYHPSGGMTGAYRRLHRDKCCPTLTTNPCQRNTMVTHPFKDRPLSVLEYKRAFGFPDEYELCGSTAKKYKALGNAVPVELSRAIANGFLKKEKTEKVEKQNHDYEQLTLF